MSKANVKKTEMGYLLVLGVFCILCVIGARGKFGISKEY